MIGCENIGKSREREWASHMVLVVKNSSANAGDIRDTGSIPGLGRSPRGRRAWQLIPVFLPGESHGQRSLVGDIGSIWLQRVRHDRSDLARRTEEGNMGILHTCHFSVSLKLCQNKELMKTGHCPEALER